MKTTQKYYYIYEIKNTLDNRLYRGKRTAYQQFEQDSEYYGTSKELSLDIEKFGKEKFEKKLLEYCKNGKQLSKREEFYVDKKWVDRTDTYNLVVANKKWDTTCLVTVRTRDGNVIMISVKDPRYISGELKHMSNTESKETKMKKSNSHKGLKHSQKTIEKMKKSNKRIGANKGKTFEELYGYEEAQKKKWKISERLKGKTNGHNGKIWIFNPLTKQRKFVINPNDYVNNGWIFGMNCFQNKIWIFNSILNNTILIEKDQLKKYIKEGWQKGRLNIPWNKNLKDDKKRIWITNIINNKTLLIEKIQLKQYIKNGWKLGRHTPWK